MTRDQAIAIGRRVVRQEAESLLEVEQRVDDGFAHAVDLVASCSGRVIVTGVGKSGLIARKIAATLTSTGTPATFLHPTESLHGDLGIVGDDDVAILLSKSGESEELLTLLSHLTRFGVRTVALVGNRASSLARECNAVLDAWVREEACPHDLAPTTSTTVALALGDALAVAVLERKGFRREDFARFHPGGSLGRKLLLRVHDVMETHRLPVLPPTAGMRDVVVLLAERRGIVVAVDPLARVVGVFTAGDFTRLMERAGDPFGIPLADAMTPNPKTAR
ncbi:MAG TPA: KpsF/GutQ family sugar-phosphate isomerase, partial [Gemmatimonadaceae bacterium]|nr:KpsF/GutQ family sugar-phosphate isomerase [Gemmatimonadaceae bacterium]